MRLLSLLSIVVCPLALAGCLPISGGSISARDLAMADRRYASLPRDLTIGYAPEPGTQRVFNAAELGRIAGANALRVSDLTDVCFEVPLRKLSEDEVVAAMRRSLPANTDVRIIEPASLAVPAGKLEFPISGLEPAGPKTGSAQLWRGYVQYGEAHRMALSARVVITATFSALVAVRDLAPDFPVAADALRQETFTGPLRKEPLVSRIEEMTGRALRAPVKAGSMIPHALLYSLPAVRRGESVPVEVRSGLAALHFVAIAESAANNGEILTLRNPLNGRTFRARLDSGAKAILVLGAGQQP